MSEDIKARLRAVAEATGPNEARDIAFEAADYIEALEAENARLREALERIAAHGYGLQSLVEDGASDTEIADYWMSEVGRRRHIARAALHLDREALNPPPDLSTFHASMEGVVATVVEGHQPGLQTAFGGLGAVIKDRADLMRADRDQSGTVSLSHSVRPDREGE